MKLYFAIIFIAFGSALGFSQVAELSIDENLHKFPNVKEGEQLEHVYIITNTGDVPLIISDYKVSCTCTKAELPESPILPGDSYPMKVTFDTNGKYYYQDRVIYLVANTKKKHKLRFKVNVIPKEESEVN